MTPEQGTGMSEAGPAEVPVDDLRPLALVPADTIALVNPMGVVPNRFQQSALHDAAGYLESRGHGWADHTTVSDTPASRAGAFNAALQPDHAALMPIAGNRYDRDTLRRIDYEQFARERPIFTTFSSGSTLLAALHERTGVPVFYGPHVRFLALDEQAGRSGPTADGYWRLVAPADQTAPTLPNTFIASAERIDNQPPVITETATTPVSGKLSPLFLQALHYCIQNQIVTDLSDRVLVLESDQTSHQEALQVLGQIHEQADLRRASAICIAGLTHHPYKDRGSDLERDLYDPLQSRQFTYAVRRLVADEIPVTYGFPMGHGAVKQTVPYGVQASLDPASNTLHLTETAVQTNAGPASANGS